MGCGDWKSGKGVLSFPIVVIPVFLPSDLVNKTKKERGKVKSGFFASQSLFVTLDYAKRGFLSSVVDMAGGVVSIDTS